MSYKLACGDIMPGCDATFSADSEADLLEQAGRTPLRLTGSRIHRRRSSTP